MKQKVIFLGLGVMGYPMAGHLSKSGYEVVVYNRTPSKAEDWLKEYQGKMITAPYQAHAPIVIACVKDDAALAAITIGEQGIFQSMTKDAIFIDHSTVSIKISQKLNTLAEEKGFYFIDAPVSGGEEGAKQGKLTIMGGAEQKEIFAQASVVMQNYAKAITHMGAVGSGQATKMVNQICIGGLLQSLAEAIYFTKQTGLDPNLVFDVISKGAAASWQMENRYHTMIEGKFDFGFAVDLMRKDLHLVLEAAQPLGIELPITQLIDSFYKDVQVLQGGRLDASSLIMRLENSHKK